MQTGILLSQHRETIPLQQRLLTVPFLWLSDVSVRAVYHNDSVMITASTY